MSEVGPGGGGSGSGAGPAEGRAGEGTRVVSLAILDGYKVRWTRETVARDIVQNFYDEVEDFAQVRIEVDEASRRVAVSGPSRFDLDYLRYLGATTKSAPAARKAGGFGEGFKICALVLVRDFHVSVTAGSGGWVIRPFLKPMALGRELHYEVRELPPAEQHPGSFVILERVDASLAAVFKTVRELFRHEGNPRLAKPIHVDSAAGVGVHEARDPYRADLFYRGQHRGIARFSKGAGITFSFDERLAALEGDRDRRNIAAATVMVAAVAERLPDEVLEKLVRRLRVYWEGGNSLLGAILAEAGRRKLRWTFPRRWLAKGMRTHNLEEHADRVGFHVAIRAMGEVGMPTVRDRFGTAADLRRLTPVEAARMRVAESLYGELVGRPLVKKRKVRVFDLEMRWSPYVSWDEISLPSRHLAASFEEGIAGCLKAIAIRGGRAAVRNSDLLTDVLAGLLRKTDGLEPYAARWEAAASTPEAVDAAGAGARVAGAGPDDADDDADDEEDERAGRGRFASSISVEILAPPGFPPTEWIVEQVKRLARVAGVPSHPIARAVSCAEQAALWYARRIPTVRIGGAEVEPVRGSTWSFSPRTFEGGRIVPGDEVVRRLIAEAGEKIRGRRVHYYGGGFFRKEAERAHDRHLAKNDPAKYREKIANRALEWMWREHRWELPHPVQLATRKLALRRLLDGEWDETGLPGAAREAGVRWFDLMARFHAELRRRAQGIADEDWGSAIGLLVKRVESRCGGGASYEEVERAGLDLVPLLVEVEGWREEAPIDKDCARTCVAVAIAALEKALEAGEGTEPAARRAREVFDGAVEAALEHHEGKDEEGEPLPCSGLREDLRKLLGLAAGKDPETKRSDAIGEAVRKAWEEEIAAGRSELEAAARCLEVAERLSAEPAEPPTGGPDS